MNKVTTHLFMDSSWDWNVQLKFNVHMKSNDKTKKVSENSRHLSPQRNQPLMIRSAKQHYLEGNKRINT